MSIQYLIGGSAKRDPNAIAIEYGDLKKSYKQLEEEISALASVLANRVAKGDIVAVYMPTCPRLVVSMLAIMRVGGIFLPIDPNGHRKENVQKLDISSPVATLTLPALEQVVFELTDSSSHKVDAGNINLIIISHVSKNKPSAGSKEQTWQIGLPDDVGYLYFTSGSTGRPKGVLGRLNSLRAFIEWESKLVGVTSSDRVSLLSPQTFDPFLRDVFLPLVNGATLCIPTQQLSVSDSHTLCDWLSTSEITISHVVPLVFELLLDTFLTKSTSSTYAPHTLLFAGEPLTPALIKKLRQHKPLSECRVINLYGTTESTLAKCANVITQQDTAYSSFPVGKPMPGVEIVFRNDNGIISDRFREGEVCFVGDVFSHGYFIDKNQPIEPTSELMLVNETLQRVCPTGDLGHLDNTGLLVVKGRKDNQVKVNGKRLELAEIEHALERVDLVSKAVVVADPRAKETRLVAWVKLAFSDAECGSDTLIDYLHGEIDSHKIPQQILFLDEFPLSAHGKIDRKRLKMMIGEQSDVVKNKLAGNMLLPLTETENWLVIFYQDLFKCVSVSCSDTFTGLGGTSMQALRALFKINHHFGCRLTMGEFMRASKLSTVASVIDRHCQENTQPSGSILSFDDKLLISHQRRLCFFQQRFPQSVAYNMTYRLSWSGALDKQRLQLALTALIDNHPELQTRFYFDNEGRFNRDVMRQYGAELKCHEVSQSDDVNGCAAGFIEKQARTLLSTGSGRPYCFSLIKLTHEKYVLVMTLHHIVADEWSIEKLFSEWIELYAHRELPATDDVKNVSTTQQGLQLDDIEQSIPQACKDYWLDQLEGVPPSSIMPADFKQTTDKHRKAGITQFNLPAELSGQCVALAAKLNVSIFSFMLSAFYLLLNKYTSQTDLVIGTPITGRTNEESLGFYVNMLCYRKQITGQQTVAEFVCDVQALHNQNLSHSEMPFDYLVEQLCSDRSDNISPLFQHSFSFAEPLSYMPQIDKCTIGQPEYVSNGECKFDFSLQLSLNGENISGRVEYDCSAYNADNINRFLQTLELIVRQMSLNPGYPISALALLPRDQYQTIIDWNNTHKDFSDNVNVAELIDSKLHQFKNNIALQTKHIELTYKQLNAATNRLTHYLISKGCTKGSRIAVSVAPSCDLIISMLAIMKAGAIYVPVDPSYPVSRRNYMLQDSQAQLMLTDGHSEQLFERGQVVSVNIEQLDLSAFSDETPVNLCGPDDVAYIIYTSGSTGNPKGVEVFHKGVCNLAEAEVDLLKVGPGSRVLQFSAFSFDTSIWEMIVTLVAGGTLVVSSRQSMMPGKNLAGLCEQFDVTHLTLPASALASMPDDSLGSVQVLIVAGEACSDLLMKKWSCDRVFINSYGPTEATVSVSNAELSAMDNKIHIGKPLANTQCWVLDENQRLLPIGAIGELCISGVGLAKGYLNKPEETQARFVLPTDLLIPASRLYRTGDVVRYLSDGNLDYLGRIDEQVKIRGFRVELAEIENCLCQHKLISDAVVLATKQHDSTDVTLIGYIVTDSQGQAFINDIRLHLNQFLPSYSVPQIIVPLPSFPKLPNNKIDRTRLQEITQPEEIHEQTTSAISNIKGVEKDLADIWSNLLNLYDVGPDTSFFEVGGHSLLAVKVVSMMRKKGWELDVNAFFDSAKLSYLASQCVKLSLDEIDTPSYTDFPAVNEPIPLTHFQQGLWFESCKGASNTYNVCKIFIFQNGFEQASLVQALNLVFRANDVFSIQFEDVEGVAHQYRAATNHRSNLAYLRDALDESEIIDFANTLAAKPITLGRSSPIESALFRDVKEQLYLVINVHHILIDDASMQELLYLIITAHDAFKSGAQPDMSQCKSFLGYARRCGHPAGERIISQRDFWTHKLNNAPSGLTLPYSKRALNHQDNNTQLGKTVSLKTSPMMTKQVLQVSAQYMATPMVTWLSIFLGFIQQYTKQNDFCVGIPVSNRPLEYTDAAIGLYLNTLVFRHQCSADVDFDTHIKQVKQCWIESYAYSDTSLSKVMEWVSGEEQTNFSLFDVMFVYKHPSEDNRVTQKTVNNDTAKFPLTFFVEDCPEGAIISVEFNTGLFEESDILNMLNAFFEYAESYFTHFNISNDVLVEPDTVSEINGVRSLNHYQKPKNTLTAIEQFEHQAQKTPNHIALQVAELRLTYFELNQLANQCAQELINLKLERLSYVGILLPRSEAMIAVLLGCLKLGVAYVPLDIGTPEKRLCYIVEDAGLDVVVVAESQLQDMQTILGSSRDLTRVISVTSLTQEKTPSSNVRYHNICPDLSTLAYIIYTSGSTGHPKGVIVDNAGLHHYLSYASDAYVFHNYGSTAFHLSFAFDASITSIFVPLLNGGTLQVIPNGDEIEQLLTLLNNSQSLDFIKLTPAHVDLLAQGLDSPVSSFDGTLVIGGDALARNMLVNIRAKLPNAKFINEYGPTEAIVGCCVYDASDVFADMSQAVPIGRPIKGIELAILDGRGHPVEQGKTGELYICGEHLARGYLNKDELTASKFASCHTRGLLFSGRCYASGDLVSELDDGNLVFKGRIDDQIKFKGYRIELSEIEAVIRQHPCIAECAVILTKKDIQQGQLLSFVTVGQHSLPVSEQQIRDLCADYLPEYMLPKSVIFIDKMPLTSNGKIDRKVLDARHQESSDKVACSDMTDTENLLYDIWHQLLNVGDIGLNDSFFSLGGDSVFCLQVVFRLRKQGFSINVETLLAHRTITQLATYLDQQKLHQQVEVSSDSLQPYEGELPLTPTQQWLFSHDGGGHEWFNQAYMYRLKRQVDINTLEVAIIHTLNRHVATRQSFSNNAQGQFQAIVKSSINTFDLNVIQTEADSETSELDWINTYVSKLDMSFDLTQPPLFKAWVFETQYSTDFRILFVAHHAVVDAISWSVLVNEISHSYAHPNVAPLHQQFDNTLADYTQWRNSDEVSSSEVNIWDSRKAQSFDPIPCHYPRTSHSNIYRHCRHFSQRLDSAKTTMLEQVNGCTIGISVQEILLAALVEAIAKWAHINQVKIDVESHGRLDESPYDLATMVGWLTAIYPTHFSDVANSQPKELLEQAAQQLREVPRKGIGYGELQASSDEGWLADAEICFNYLGKSFSNASKNDDIIQTMDPGFNVQRHAPELNRWHLIEFDAWIEQGCCQISWSFSKALHDTNSIARLAELFEQSLDKLLETAKSTVKSILVPADLPKSVSMDLSNIADVQRHYPNVQQILSATPAQQGMAFHTLYNSGGPIYHEQILYCVSIPLDLERFHSAWHTLISRHVMLRCSMDTERFPSPVIIVHQPVYPVVGYIDLSAMTQHEQDDYVKSLMDVDLACPFILDKSPLIRAHLILTGEASSQLLISHHHGILDGWSLTLIIDELNALLSQNIDQVSCFQNPQSDLSGIEHFSEYVSQHSYPDVTFWEDILDQNMMCGSLPFVTLKDEEEGSRAAIHHQVQIDARDMAVVYGATSELNVTLSTLIQGAWALVLHHFTCNQETIFGVTLSGRSIDVEQAESLVGLCINTLPMRVSIEPERQCGEWLWDIQKVMYSIQNHSQTSLPELSKMCQPGSRNALFDSIVVLTNYQTQIDPNKNAVIHYKHSRESTNFPLTLVISESEEGLDCRLSGLPDRINPLWLAPVLRVFSDSLVSLAQNKTSTVSAAIRAGNDQRQDNLSCIVGYSAPLTGLTPSAKLAQFAKSYPQQIAVTDTEGELSYAQLDSWVNALGQKITEQINYNDLRGLQQPVIGVCCKRNRALLTGLLSCLRLNAVFLPLDPDLPLNRLTYMAENASVSLILSDDPDLFSGTLLAKHILHIESKFEPMLCDAKQEVVRPFNAVGDDLAYIMYTSGSTGKPKGVKVGVESLLNYLEYASKTYSSGQPISSCVHSSIGFDGTISSLFIPIMTGGTVKMISEENTLGELAGEIRRTSQSLLIKITPSHLTPLAEQLHASPIKHLKAIIIGGEALDYRHLAAFKHCAPDAMFVNEYGPTEATVGCCINIFNPFDLEQGAVPIGRPIQNTELLICSDDMCILPVGAVGELCIGGSGVAQEYINMSTITGEKFVMCAGPDNRNRRVYRTGDMIYCEPDGTLHYLGRQDDQVKLNGVRIELGEIEEVVRQHAEVDSVAVVVSAIRQNQLLAFVAGYKGETPDKLRQKLLLTLPTYMMPRQIIYSESLPLTVNGKVDRSLLMQVDVTDDEQANDFVKAETEVQHQVCAIFAQLLRLERVGIKDDFFVLGGHSLTAMQLLARIAQRFGVSISLKMLFSSSAVWSLAALIEKQLHHCAEQSIEDKRKVINATTSIPSIQRASRRIN